MYNPIVLEQVASGRKEAADWSAINSEESTRVDNRGHWYFIIVLQDVLRTLRPLYSSSSAAEPEARTQTEAAEENTINPFDILEVEEAGEGCYPLPTAAAPKEKKPAAIYTIQVDGE
ncbi:hypothetical protein L207DRAFT_592235 [Hyaloscypha variabilis F]|uniref:DUF6604 domain-containing protein n=1 Tax=Hyaloscypha variabilis (strain UAMH 11265 / GT02V1 / F) TaxID=1149755 RepID=A0A2J6QX75_HYAVF|nr:hypothetical protein L207DRAFT_592235 [Hyaloscypha variabilis F]